MRTQHKRKYRLVRKEFRRELFEIAKENHTLAMLIFQTYVASQHRTHITKIWDLLGFHHKEAYKDYCDKLFGKYLSGTNDLWKSLHFAGYKEIREKFIRKIPEKCAMGDALAVAYKVLKGT
ncbi:hypothetical protein ACFVS2_26115 [Brevibacillus sp. NPDC058079]|uniref:hypothetical protein n=1 Tax=Brevibacillus sp. NPDC058079 TaxID=3346330 RepID=UPI0036ED21A4